MSVSQSYGGSDGWDLSDGVSEDDILGVSYETVDSYIEDLMSGLEFEDEEYGASVSVNRASLWETVDGILEEDDVSRRDLSVAFGVAVYEAEEKAATAENMVQPLMLPDFKDELEIDYDSSFNKALSRIGLKPRYLLDPELVEQGVYQHAINRSSGMHRDARTPTEALTQDDNRKQFRPQSS